MTNPLVHALVLMAAVLIPGGLIVYLAWAARKVRVKKCTSQKPTPEEARTAFRAMFPLDSLRAKNRLAKLSRYRHTVRKDREDTK